MIRERDGGIGALLFIASICGGGYVGGLLGAILAAIIFLALW